VKSSDLPSDVIEVGPGFWNIRGSFKVFGVVQIGTHSSLVRRSNGSYVVLDACGLSDDIRTWLERQTEGGERLEALVNLHPFHTLHVKTFAGSFPKAKLYGTKRHIERLRDLPWQPVCTEDAELRQELGEDLEFSVPRGVELVPADPNLHFGSVLAFHRATKTLHVDDTLTYLRMPWPVRVFKRDSLSFHPTLAKVLEQRPGAVADFRRWASELVERTKGVDNLCAAHMGNLLARHNEGASISERVQRALEAIEGKLSAHERKFG
jgi:hypothetical protein